MEARKVAAQFAAYVWYEENRAGKQSQEETVQFAKENWTAFLPIAHQGVGRLLIRIASQRPNRKRRLHTSLAVVG